MSIAKKRKSKFVPRQIFIARSIDGTLELFSSKPWLDASFHWESDIEDWLDYLDDSFYPELTFENSPKKLKL